jgi:hypothetical protein
VVTAGLAAADAELRHAVLRLQVESGWEVCLYARLTIIASRHT